MQEMPDGLPMLDDMPVTADEDRLHHGLYAETLRSVFANAKCGMSVGLLGRWGVGKSTVLKLLMANPPSGCELVEFNAWKSTGDSVRRQMLLRVLSAIDSPKLHQLKRFTQTVLPVELRQCENAELFDEDYLNRFVVAVANPPKAVQVAQLVAASLVCLVIVVLVFAWLDTVDSRLATLLVSSCLTVAGVAYAIVKDWANRAKRAIVAYAEPVSDSQRLRYPEQFEELFVSEVRAYWRRTGKRLIVAVDDLDRCDPVTIVEALAAVRQFSEMSDFPCQFLLPCDEGQVVDALRAAGHTVKPRENEEFRCQSEELLRKFFDVAVRMHEIHPSDLSDFAASLSSQTHTSPQDARELVGLANPREPRLVKKLLNALSVSRHRVQSGIRHGTFPSPDQLPGFDATLRLMVVLRETRPDIYRLVARDPGLVNVQSRQEEWAKITDGDPSAVPVRDMIAVADAAEDAAEVLVYGKLPFGLHGVSGAGRLVRAVRAYDIAEVEQCVAAAAGDDVARIQEWLCREGQSVRSGVAARRMMRMFMQLGSCGGCEAISRACARALLSWRRFLPDVLGDDDCIGALAPLVAELPAALQRTADRIVVRGFVGAKGRSDRQLEYLLARCNRLAADDAATFRQWIEAAVREPSGDRQVVKRLSRALPQDRSSCYGFAPLAAAAIAGGGEWSNEEEAPHGGSGAGQLAEVIVTLLGDSAEGAKGCLQNVFERNGPLASPKAIGEAGHESRSPFTVVRRCFDLVDDEVLARYFESWEGWMSAQRRCAGTQLVAESVRKCMLRWPERYVRRVAGLFADRVMSRQDETFLIDIVGGRPGEPGRLPLWEVACKECLSRMLGVWGQKDGLAAHEKEVLLLIQKNGWPAASFAEHLLIQKLDARDDNAMQAWLGVLSPFVSPSSHPIREAAYRGLSDPRTAGRAIDLGRQVLWRQEIDPESADRLGIYWASHPEELVQGGGAVVGMIRQPGGSTILDAVLDRLPMTCDSMRRYWPAMDVLASCQDIMTVAHRKAFAKRVDVLLVSEDSTVRMRGYAFTKIIGMKEQGLARVVKRRLEDNTLSDEEQRVVKELLSSSDRGGRSDRC